MSFNRIPNRMLDGILDRTCSRISNYLLSVIRVIIIMLQHTAHQMSNRSMFEAEHAVLNDILCRISYRIANRI